MRSYVRTNDDLEAIGAEDSSSAIATASQMLPAFCWGLSGEARVTRLSFRGRLDHLAYVETVNSTNLEMKRYKVIIAEVGTWW